jgi:hypothetical protein
MTGEAAGEVAVMGVMPSEPNPYKSTQTLDLGGIRDVVHDLADSEGA